MIARRCVVSAAVSVFSQTVVRTPTLLPLFVLGDEPSEFVLDVACPANSALTAAGFVMCTIVRSPFPMFATSGSFVYLTLFPLANWKTRFPLTTTTFAAGSWLAPPRTVRSLPWPL